MKRAKKILWKKEARLWGMALVLMLALGFAFVNFSLVSHAESKGKVTASGSVNIRKEPNASSAKVGSAEKDAVVDIRGKATASDGTVWYQVYVNATTTGFVRSDLVEITDGTTPPTVEAGSSSSATTTTPSTGAAETPVEVTAVNPLSATVTNGQKVRVRSNASTTSSIITSVQSGSALTVTGQATGLDAKTWYQVEFISNGTSVVGFIRSDFVTLSGELVPVTDTPQTPETPTEPETPAEPEAPEMVKEWETQLQGDKWYLLNMVNQTQTEINSLYDAAETNAKLYEESEKTVKSQKIVIIVLVILLIGAAAAAALFFLKIKDMMDSAYFSEVERDTVRRRGEGKAQNDRRVVHTVGPDKKPNGNKPVGGKPQGGRPAAAQPQGSRPQGTRPAGAQPQGSRPQGSKPAGAQPQGSKPQGTRPAAAQPQGSRPQGSKPVGAQPQGNKPQGARPAGAQPQGGKPVNGQPNPGWKSKNFMSDDDEFEFEFLNWDGEEEQ